MPAGSAVLDVTDATFATEVLERSKTKPVVVDFWAPWCGPCRVLGPIIEKVSAEYGDDLVLAKLNTDENPRTATTFRIQGIPAVKAFVGAKVVAEFTGAIPETQVRAFFKQFAPSPAEKAAKEAQGIVSTDPVEAERRFREILASAPGNPDAIVGLATILLGRGETDEAEELLGRAPTDRRAKVLKHRIFLDGFAARHGTEDLEGEARANPRDPRAVTAGASCSRRGSNTNSPSTSSWSPFASTAASPTVRPARLPWPSSTSSASTRRSPATTSAASRRSCSEPQRTRREHKDASLRMRNLNASTSTPSRLRGSLRLRGSVVVGARRGGG